MGNGTPASNGHTVAEGRIIFYDEDADVQLVTLENAFKLLLALASTGINTGAAPPVYSAERRKTVRQGLRILARTIARAHLGRHGERDSAAAPGPPPMGRRSERTIPEARGAEWQP